MKGQKAIKISELKHVIAETIETVHTHTHTLYVYQINKKLNKNDIKNRRKNLWI